MWKSLSPALLFLHPFSAPSLISCSIFYFLLISQFASHFYYNLTSLHSDSSYSYCLQDTLHTFINFSTMLFRLHLFNSPSHYHIIVLSSYLLILLPCLSVIKWSDSTLIFSRLSLTSSAPLCVPLILHGHFPVLSLVNPRSYLLSSLPPCISRFALSLSPSFSSYRPSAMLSFPTPTPFCIPKTSLTYPLPPINFSGSLPASPALSPCVWSYSPR